MAIVNTHYGFCAKGGAAVKFTYTGEYNVRDDGVVELLTSGTITFLNPAVIDIFCVGGGGGGSTGNGSAGGLGGGGGGYTETSKRNSVDINTPYEVKIGNGGKERQPGEPSSFGTLISARGGSGGSQGARSGAPGGSGGGGGTKSTQGKGYGGSNGENGGAGDGGNGGAGQGSTTKEFGEVDGKLYAGGGAGGSYFSSDTPIVNMGGAGGGGNGAWRGSAASGQSWQAAAAGAANTGGGGGGGAIGGVNKYTEGASGGSGIVCLRVAKD